MVAESVAILSFPPGSPGDNAPPEIWGRPWRNPFCHSCRHPPDPKGARDSTDCRCLCHADPEAEGR